MKLKIKLSKEKSGDTWLHVETAKGLYASINLGCRDPKRIVQQALDQAIKEQDEI